MLEETIHFFLNTVGTINKAKSEIYYYSQFSYASKVIHLVKSCDYTYARGNDIPSFHLTREVGQQMTITQHFTLSLKIFQLY